MVYIIETSESVADDAAAAGTVGYAAGGTVLPLRMDPVVATGTCFSMNWEFTSD